MDRLKNLFFLFTNLAYGRVFLWFSGIKRETHVYAVSGGRKMKLDVYRAKNANGLAPVLVYTHGGGWRLGSRRHIEPAFHAQVKRGYGFVSVSYSMTNKGHWPMQIHEVKAAYRWVRANAKMFDFDSTRIIATGASAGGHLACVAGLSGNGVLEGNLGETDASSAVAAIMTYYPPTDLETLYRMGEIAKRSVGDLLGGSIEERREHVSDATPMTHVGSAPPPIYIAHGDADHVVPFEHAQKLVSAVTDAGGEAELVRLENRAHADWRFNDRDQVTKFEAFLDRVAGRP